MTWWEEINMSSFTPIYFLRVGIIIFGLDGTKYSSDSKLPGLEGFYKMCVFFATNLKLSGLKIKQKLRTMFSLLVERKTKSGSHAEIENYQNYCNYLVSIWVKTVAKQQQYLLKIQWHERMKIYNHNKINIEFKMAFS